MNPSQTQADAIKRVEMSDGGDGSTFVTVEFEDGSLFYAGPDVPYEGKVVFERNANGVLEDRVEIE